MTIKELVEALKEYDENTKVIVTKWSDYNEVDSVDIVRVVPKGNYIERYYSDQYKNEEQPNTILAVYLGY